VIAVDFSLLYQTFGEIKPQITKDRLFLYSGRVSFAGGKINHSHSKP
jgi:hypothetical protein